MTDEILTVHRVSTDGGDYCVRCPHCKTVVGIDGHDLSEIRGEQYLHGPCSGWFQIDDDARFVHPTRYFKVEP